MHYPLWSVRPLAKSQHLDGFGAQECHARRIGLGPGAGPGEVPAQVRAHPVQDLRHSAAAGAIVRFAPESASKTATFVVSRANSIDCPMVALDSAGTRATNWFSY